MTGLVPISDLIAAIVANVLDKRQREARRAADSAPVPEDPELARQADAWVEPEVGG